MATPIIGPINTDYTGDASPYPYVSNQAICAFNDTYAGMTSGYQLSGSGSSSVGGPFTERVIVYQAAADGTLTANYLTTWTASGPDDGGGANFIESIVGPVLGGDYVVQLLPVYDNLTTPSYVSDNYTVISLVHVDSSGTPTVAVQITPFQETQSAVDFQQPYIFKLDDTHLLYITGNYTSGGPNPGNMQVITLTPTSMTVSAVLGTLPDGCFANYLTATEINGGGLMLACSIKPDNVSTDIWGRIITYANGVLTDTGPLSVLNGDPILFTQYPGIAGVNPGEFISMVNSQANGPEVRKYLWDGTAVTVLATSVYNDYNFGNGSQGNNSGEAGNSRFGIFNGEYAIVLNPYQVPGTTTPTYVEIVTDIFGTPTSTKLIENAAKYNQTIAAQVGNALIAFYYYYEGAQAFVFAPPGLGAALNTRRVTFQRSV